MYDGPVVQLQDLTVFNITKEAVVARQAQVEPQPRPVPGKPRTEPTAHPPAQPDWWADALIPLDDVFGVALDPRPTSVHAAERSPEMAFASPQRRRPTFARTASGREHRGGVSCAVGSQGRGAVSNLAENAPEGAELTDR